MLLNISNIQHFSTGDGPGIRTTVFFKGCNLRCPWCHNPETVSGEAVELYYKSTGKRELHGKIRTPEEVMDELLQDVDFYSESGGGVTFSGGEVMLQADAAAELGAMIRDAGISLAVDTAGCVPYSAFERLNPYADLYLYDIKTPSEEAYHSVIGGDLRLVVDNLGRLIADGKNVRVRIPLIPDFNTDADSVSRMCGILTELGITEADLLPFHRMGVGKYDAMELSYQYKDTPALSGQMLRDIEEKFSQYIRIHTEK